MAMMCLEGLQNETSLIRATALLTTVGVKLDEIHSILPVGYIRTVSDYRFAPQLFFVVLVIMLFLIVVDILLHE